MSEKNEVPMNVNIQSSVISDKRRDAILTKVIDEITLTMENVFGPLGTNVYISTGVDNNLYFTRDGKEVFNSIHFDNPLAEQIKNLIGQAVNNQASTIGDGTTSVSLLIPEIIRAINKHRSELKNTEKAPSNFEYKNMFKKATSILREEYNILKKPIKYMDTDFRSLIYTTTGDVSFIKEIEENVPEMSANTLIDVVLNENSSTIVYDVNKEPKIDTNILYSSKSLKKTGGGVKLDNCGVIFVDGTFSISKWQTLGLLHLMKNIKGIDNIVVLCASMDKDVSESIRECNNKFISLLDPSAKELLSNIVVLKLPTYMGMSKEELLDISTLVYYTDRNISIGQPIDFEPKLYTSLREIASGNTLPETFDLLTVNEFEEFDADEEITNSIKDSLLRPLKVEITDRSSRIHAVNNAAMEKRVGEIKKELGTSTSIFARNNFITRLNRLEADRLTVRVGAELLSNAQNHTELLLDALKAGRIALEHGIVYGGALTKFKEISERVDSNEDKILLEIIDLIKNVFIYLLKKIYPSESDYGKIYIDGEYHNIKNELRIVEPVESGLKLLDAIDLSVDIACSNIFTTKSFIGNYI